jgi:hypothetical protein
MADAMLGIVMAPHDSPLNKVYFRAFEGAYGKRPSFISLGRGSGCITTCFQAIPVML